MPRPSPLSSLKKISFPSPITVGTDIVHIPRIHEILRRNRSKPGTAWAFARRILGEEEIEGSKHRFETAFQNHDELRRSWCVAKAFRKEVELTGLLKGGNGVEEGTRGAEGVGKEIDGLIGGGFGEGVVPMVRAETRRRMDVEMNFREERYVLSKEGVVMAVLRAVIEWKKSNGREEVQTPWAVLMGSSKGGKDMEGVIDEVLNAMKASTGQETVRSQEEAVGGYEKVANATEDERALLDLDSDGHLLDHERDSITNKPMSGNSQDVVTIDRCVDTSKQALDINNGGQDVSRAHLSGTSNMGPQQNINIEQTPRTTTSKEVETMLLNDQTEASQQSTDTASTSTVPKSRTQKPHNPNPPTTTGLQTDITLFLALERSLHASIQQAELDLQPPAIFFAGRFAAKEAIMKAYHSRHLTYHDITIVSQPADETGSRPPLGYVLEGAEAREVRFSISHHREYATATAMVFTEVEGVGKKKGGKKDNNRLKGRFWEKKREEGKGEVVGVEEVDVKGRGANAKVRRVESDGDELNFRKIVVPVRDLEEGIEKKEEGLHIRRIEGDAEVKEGIDGVKTTYVESKGDKVPTFLW